MLANPEDGLGLIMKGGEVVRMGRSRRTALLPLTVKWGILVTVAMFALVVPSTLHAQPSIDSLAEPDSTPAQPVIGFLAGPNSTPALLAQDDQEWDTVLDVDLLQPWRDWKASLKDRTGLDFGFDYISLGYVATESLGEETAATGVFRLFGQWELTGRGTKNTGTLLFRVDNRHRLDTVPVRDFAGELGYAGIMRTTEKTQSCTWNAGLLFKIIMNKNTRDSRLEKVQAP